MRKPEAPKYRVRIIGSEWRGWNADGFSYYTRKSVAEEAARAQCTRVEVGPFPGKRYILNAQSLSDGTPLVWEGGKCHAATE